MTQPFSSAASVCFYSPLPDGRVDASQGAINVPVLPGSGVSVFCAIQGASSVNATFEIVDRTGTNRMRDLLDIVRTAGPGVQWFSPHARSVFSRYIQWAAWQERFEHPEMPIWGPSLSFLDPVQELNKPAYMSLQDRQAWSPDRVLQLFPKLLHASEVDLSHWPLVVPEVVSTVWYNLAIFLHTTPSCPNLAT